MPFKFEQLTIWQQAIELSSRINELCKSFPKDELFILTSQIKRAVDSVSLNIAEGSTGQSDQEFNRFLGYALRLAMELVSCLYIARGRGYITEETFNEHYIFLDTLCKKIQPLRNTLK